MSASPREIVRRALRFEHPPRMPRDLWVLPWAETHLAACVAELRRRWPSDLTQAPDVYHPSPRVRGDWYEVGEYTDEWGCRFTNIQKGVIGEVREPLVTQLSDWRGVVKPPFDVLPADAPAARDKVNRAMGAMDQFVQARCWFRPWERYQFLRGSANALMDMADPDAETRALLRAIHEFYLRELKFWCSTDVDAIGLMDDWGSQQALLIQPATWRELFKPMYRDYCALARSHGKFVWMHSDGHITAIYPDLIEIGVDAINSQLFCMDMAALARVAKGRITFWGEIDRQQVLPSPDPEAGRKAVRQVARHLYDPRGGIIAQFELTAGANPATAIAIFEEWDKINAEAWESGQNQNSDPKVTTN